MPCKVKSCTRDSSTFKLHFFPFPENRKLAEKWLALCACELNCPIEWYNITASDQICSKHFALDAFIEQDYNPNAPLDTDTLSKQRPKLKPDAKPTLYLPSKEVKLTNYLTLTETDKSVPENCVVGGCTSSRYAGNSYVRYHYVPTSDKASTGIQNKWIEFVQSTRDDFTPGLLQSRTHPRNPVCSWHFTPDQYVAGQTKMFKFKINLKHPNLKRDSVPHLKKATNPFPEDFFVEKPTASPSSSSSQLHGLPLSSTVIHLNNSNGSSTPTQPAVSQSTVSSFVMPKYTAFPMEMPRSEKAQTTLSDIENSKASTVIPPLTLATSANPLEMTDSSISTTAVVQSVQINSTSPAVIPPSTPSANLLKMFMSEYKASLSKMTEPELPIITTSENLLDITDSSASSSGMTQNELTTIGTSESSDVTDSEASLSVQALSERTTTTLTNLPNMKTCEPFPTSITPLALTTSSNSVDMTDSETSLSMITQPECTTKGILARLLDRKNSLPNMETGVSPPTVINPSANSLDMNDSLTSLSMITQPELPNITTSANSLDMSDSSTSLLVITQPEITIGTSVNSVDISDAASSVDMMDDSSMSPSVTTSPSSSLLKNLLNLNKPISSPDETNMLLEASSTSTSPRLTQMVQPCAANSIDAELYMQPEELSATASAKFQNTVAKRRRITVGHELYEQLCKLKAQTGVKTFNDVVKVLLDSYEENHKPAEEETCIFTLKDEMEPLPLDTDDQTGYNSSNESIESESHSYENNDSDAEDDSLIFTMKKEEPLPMDAEKIQSLTESSNNNTASEKSTNSSTTKTLSEEQERSHISLVAVEIPPLADTQTLPPAAETTMEPSNNSPTSRKPTACSGSTAEKSSEEQQMTDSSLVAANILPLTDTQARPPAAKSTIKPTNYSPASRETITCSESTAEKSSEEQQMADSSLGAVEIPPLTDNQAHLPGLESTIKPSNNSPTSRSATCSKSTAEKSLEVQEMADSSLGALEIHPLTDSQAQLPGLESTIKPSNNSPTSRSATCSESTAEKSLEVQERTDNSLVAENNPSLINAQVDLPAWEAHIEPSNNSPTSKEPATCSGSTAEKSLEEQEISDSSLVAAKILPLTDTQAHLPGLESTIEPSNNSPTSRKPTTCSGSTADKSSEEKEITDSSIVAAKILSLTDSQALPPAAESTIKPSNNSPTSNSPTSTEPTTCFGITAEKSSEEQEISDSSLVALEIPPLTDTQAHLTGLESTIKPSNNSPTSREPTTCSGSPAEKSSEEQKISDSSLVAVETSPMDDTSSTISLNHLRQTMAESKKKAATTHPPCLDMIVAAIGNLEEKNGSSAHAIKKYIATNYNVDIKNNNKLLTFIKKAFVTGVQKKKLIQTKGKGAHGSFKLNAVPFIQRDHSYSIQPEVSAQDKIIPKVEQCDNVLEDFQDKGEEGTDSMEEEDEEETLLEEEDEEEEEKGEYFHLEFKDDKNDENYEPSEDEDNYIPPVKKKKSDNPNRIKKTSRQEGDSDEDNYTPPVKKKRYYNPNRIKETSRQVIVQAYLSKIKCKLCEELLADLDEMKQHIIEKHSSQQTLMPKRHKDRIVKEKSLGTVDASDTVSDLEVSALSTMMRLCPTCQEYIPQTNMTKHVDKHEPRNYICELCGLALRQFCAAHICLNKRKPKKKRKTRRRPLKPTQCERCGKTCKNKNEYAKHLVTHLTVKPFQCSECDKGFSQKSNLNIHERIHSGDKPYKCDICTMAYAHNVSLKTHKKKAHGVDMWAEKPSEAL